MPDLPALSLLADITDGKALSLTLLEITPTSLLLFRPVYEQGSSTITDLVYEYVNPAAQQLLRLPERPAGSFRIGSPLAEQAELFTFCCDAFVSAKTKCEDVNLPQDGLDRYFHVVARRHEALLVVSLSETNNQPRATGPDAAEALQHQQRSHWLLQVPAIIGVLDGPQHVVQFVSPLCQALLGERPLLGSPVALAIPELIGHPALALLDAIYSTGEPCYATQMPVRLVDAALAKRYFDFSFKALRDPQGAIGGVLVFAYEVTPQVLARRQAQQLNDELELRVTARSAEIRVALHEAETQRALLQTQQGLLDQILGQVPAAIATLSGPEHRYSFFNEPYQVLSAGRTALGLTVAEVFPEVVEQGFIGLLDRVYATGQPFIGTETLAMLHDPATGQAEQRYVDFIYQPLFDDQQCPQGILAFILDVTDRVRSRKQAETLQASMLAVVQRQAQQRQDLLQLFRQQPMGIVLLRDADHRIDYFNPAFEALFPPPAGAELVPGRPLAETYAPIRPTSLLEAIDRVFATGESQSMNELPLARLYPGSPRYVTLAYQAYREQSHIVGVAAFVYDVTEQVRARQAHEAQQQRLERLLMQAPAPICILGGTELIFELVNPSYQRLFPGRTLLGKPVFEALPELEQQPESAMLWKVYETGVTFEGQEICMPFANQSGEGSEDRYFNFIYQARYATPGLIDGVVVFAFEVTEQVRARLQVQLLNQELAAINEELRATNAKLHESNTQLTRTNADLDTFVYSASHDLKSPITNIEGLLLALQEHLPANALDDPLVPRLLDMMQGAVGRFQQTLGHLTNITRLQQTHLSLPTEEIDLPALVEAVRLDMLPELTEAGATLTVDLAACPRVRFSTKSLRSIVYNLLSNAVKYRDPARPAVVSLRCHTAPGWVVLEVQDNGLGLSAEQQGELFRMFRRLHSHVPGSGVGLYMIKKMVENAGGTLTVHSQPGVGSTFTVALPHAG